jgi:hypothetical protein
MAPVLPPSKDQRGVRCPQDGNGDGAPGWSGKGSGTAPSDLAETVHRYRAPARIQDMNVAWHSHCEWISQVLRQIYEPDLQPLQPNMYRH